MINLLHGDCLELMKNIEDNSINLICIDPPYNIKKASWDKWKNVSDYVSFMGEVFKECRRVLKDNGSFYFFHNDFLQMVELQNFINKNTDFVFKQMIVWNKKFEGYWNQLNAIVSSEDNRNYSKQAEYCLFYTVPDVSGWDRTGLESVKLDINNFKPLRQYFKDFQTALGMNKKQIMERVGQRADHPFRWGSSQWDMPTKETYDDLFKLPLKHEFIRKEYEEVRKEYEELRKEYEELRYTFNNQKSHHSVWNYEIAKNIGHCTPKPLDLIENIIKHSSNENDLVLDCFMGSGTCGLACKNLNRNFIGIEKDDNYFKIAEKRINEV
jgi:site-specific DNA-methyltransferase (adenine-specific)